MAAEINDETKFKLGIKDVFNIGVMIIGITMTFITTKITTQYEIDNLKNRIEKIEQVKPEQLQWELKAVNERLQEFKKAQDDQNGLIKEIYNTLIK